MIELHRDQTPGFFGAMKANAAFSALSGLTMAAAPAVVSGWLGLEADMLIRVLGLGLLLFAIRLAWIGRIGRVASAEARAIVAGDLMWVTGSAGLLAAYHDRFSSVGVALIAVTAGVVLFFALLQSLGLRHQQPGAAPL